MIFDVRGPYELKRIGPKGLVNRDSREALQECVATEDEGLLDACGCYVFSLRAGPGFTPWYVGQSQKRSIIQEAMNSDNLVKYNEVLNGRKGTPILFLLPLQTPTGRYAKQPDGSLPAIDFLERWLIAAALEKNPDLINNRETKFLREIHVRGILNASQGEAHSASTALRQTLGLK
jgi:hypothetical protein